MRKAIMLISVIVLLSGCAIMEGKKDKEIEKGLETAGQLVQATSGLTGQYGAIAAAVLAALNGAYALHKSKQARTLGTQNGQLAQAAVEAGHATPGGGKALVNAAIANGVALQIRDAYNVTPQPEKAKAN